LFGQGEYTLHLTASLNKYKRGKMTGQEKLDIATLIAIEIEVDDSELVKYLEYDLEIGSPPEWWKKNCANYRLACDRCNSAEEIAEICKIAEEIHTEMLSEYFDKCLFPENY
jgi:hypothetical protein